MLTTIRHPELTPEERESRMQEIKTAAVRLLLAAERGERHVNDEKHSIHRRGQRPRSNHHEASRPANSL